MAQETHKTGLVCFAFVSKRTAATKLFGRRLRGIDLSNAAV